MAESQANRTLTEESPPPRTKGDGPRAWLIYIGSPEDQFQNAGRVLALDDIRTVRFGRGRNRLEDERSGTTLHVTVPLGWVSGAHAELRIVPTEAGNELDVRDLSSRNGTHIERQPVPGIARLEPGQVFEIGRSFWMVRMVGSRDPVPVEGDALGGIGSSNPSMCGILRTLGRLAKSDVPLLLYGETGTGKEVLARAIHEASGRAGQLVIANLSAISDTRVDAALLGGVGPDPAGATQEGGLFEQAHGGTLFLDELGELTPTLQAKLLAILTESSVTRLGDAQARAFDVRLICASLHDIHGMVLDGSFRPDLYSRLVGFQAELLPLRQRREDLGMLTSTLCRHRHARIRLSTRAFRRILDHDWPYNVRELEQTIATASILAGSEGEITREVIDEIVERRGDMPREPEGIHELRAELVDQLARSGGDTAEVARAMQRDLTEIQRWLERFELRPEAYREPGSGTLVDLGRKPPED